MVHVRRRTTLLLTATGPGRGTRRAGEGGQEDQRILASPLDGVWDAVWHDRQCSRRDRSDCRSTAYRALASDNVNHFIEIGVCVLGERVPHLE